MVDYFVLEEVYFLVTCVICGTEVHKALGVFKDPRKPLTVSFL